VQTAEGVEAIASAKVTFLEDVQVESPDVMLIGCRRCNVLAVDRVLDPAGGGYYTEVWSRMASQGVPSWNQILSFLQQMAQLRESAGSAA
jgi:hypothetical protein